MPEDLSAELFKFSKKVIEKTSEHEDEMKSEEKPFSKLIVDDYNYDNILKSMSNPDEVDHRTGAVTWDTEKITRSERNISDIFNFIQNELRELDEYDKLLGMISNRAKHSEDEEVQQLIDDPDILLDEFLVRFITDILEDDVGDTYLISAVSSFQDELENNSVFWEPTIFMTGIAMESDSINLLDNTQVRRPSEKELEEEIPLENPWMSSGFHHQWNTPSLVVTHECKASNIVELYNQIDEIVSVFRLFKVGSVQMTGVGINPTSPFQPESYWREREDKPTPFEYVIKEGENSAFQNFFDVIYPIFVKEISNSDGDSFLDIAFDRYENAILDDAPPESRLVSAIMSLEALYLAEEERGELSERLSNRAAITLGFFGSDPLDIYQKVKKGYDLRSKYVHGSKIEKKAMKGVEKLEKHLLDYARKTILIYLQIDDGKGELIPKLDKSLIKTDINEGVKGKILDSCEYTIRGESPE